MIGCVAVVADCQMQGVSAGTTVIVGISIGIRPCGSIRGSMPSVTVARNSGLAVVCCVVNCQVEEYKTIASGHVGS